MDNHQSKHHRLYPKSLSITKVIAPIKYKRKIVRTIEKLGEIEPIDVDPRTGTDHISIEERRNEIELLRTKFNNILSNIDDANILTASPIDFQEDEENLVNKLNSIYNEKGKEIEEVVSRRVEIAKRIEDLEGISKLLTELDSLGMGSELNVKMLADTKHTTTFVGKIIPSQSNTLHWYISEVTENRYFIKEEQQSEQDIIALITVLKEDTEAVSSKLKVINFRDIVIPHDLDFDGLSKSDCEEEINDLTMENKVLEDNLVSLSQKNGYDLLAAREICEIELQRISVEFKMRRTSSTCVLWAWLPEERKEEFKTAMHQTTGGSAIVDFRQGDFDPKITPSYTKNSEFMAPMRSLVTAYGTPSKHEIDPYPFVKFLFPILFAIMFGDVGHGTLLFLFGIYAKKKKDQMKEIPKGISGYFYGGAELLIIMGATSFFMGFALNSVFGDETILWSIPPIRAIFENTTWKFFFTLKTEVINGHEETIIKRNYVNFLIFSFAVGAVVILMGLFINLYQLKNYRHSNSELYAALTLTAVYLSAVFASIAAALQQSAVVTLFVILIVVNIIATFVIEYRSHGVDGLMLGVDHVISLLSNTFSFGRLLAMNTIHFVLAFLPYLFLDKIPVLHGVLNETVDSWLSSGILIAAWILGAAIGAAIILPVETTFSTLQSLRLNWVEFFGKFYKGNGKEFKPVKVNRIYTLEPTLGR